MQEVSEFIGRIGFPVFVAVWLLMRTDKLLVALTEAVTELRLAIHDARDDHGGD